jgi:NNP family nitrate/nitrite transporter-like MFS transporter
MRIADLFKIKNPQMRALHLTWIAFFICFYTWFNMAPLATTLARQFNGLTPEDIKLLAICNIALTIPSRILIGMAIDRWGPRRVFSLLMVTMSVPVFLFAFGNQFAQLFISRLLLGCIGAGFVVGTHMTSLWFSPKEIGFAQGIYAGWGNFGSAAAAMTLPAIALHFFGGDNGWRYAIAANGLVMLAYGVFYWFAITDGPEGSVIRRPRRVAAMEVSSRADMIKLIFWTIPTIGALALFVWKVQGMGYLSQAASWLAYLLIATIVAYQISQVLNVNLPLLKKGVPADDRYSFDSVAALSLAYFATFGAELAVVSMLPAFFETTFGQTPAAAGLIAASFPVVNLFIRPIGGVLSDRTKSRRRVMIGFMLGVAAGFFCMGFMNASWPLWAAVFVTVFCALSTQGATGATFAVIPTIKRRLTGQISGMAGAYGNIGALVYLTLYSFVTPQTFFFVMAAGACVSFTVCFFFLKETKAAFASDYRLSSVDRTIEGEAILANFIFDEEERRAAPRLPGEEQVQMVTGMHVDPADEGEASPKEFSSNEVDFSLIPNAGWDGRVRMEVSWR